MALGTASAAPQGTGSAQSRSGQQPPRHEEQNAAVDNKPEPTPAVLEEPQWSRGGLGHGQGSVLGCLAAGRGEETMAETESKQQRESSTSQLWGLQPPSSAQSCL